MISKYVQSILPDASLLEYVQSYQIIDLPFETMKELEFTVFPTSHTRMVLTLGEPSFQKVGQQMIKTIGSSITGYYSRPHAFVPASSSLRQIIIQFSPCGMQPMLDFPLSEITDDRADLNLIFEDKMEELFLRIEEKEDRQTIKMILDNFFTGLLKKKKQIDPRIKSIIPRIFNSHGSSRLGEIAKESCLGERTLQRIIHNNVGVSYKFFSKLVRMQYARGLLNRDDLYLTEVALKAGYFDQAHFNHEFLTIYGESPDAYRKRRHQLMWHQLESKIGS